MNNFQAVLSISIKGQADFGCAVHTFASNLSQEVPVIVEHLDAVSSVVADEDLLSVVDHDAVGELQVLGAAKLVEYVSHLIKNNDTHDLKYYHLTDKKIALCHTSLLSITLDLQGKYFCSRRQNIFKSSQNICTLHSTTMIRPLLSTQTPRGCWRIFAPNFLTNCPYWL